MTAIAEVQSWLKSMVIGLGLCPFADKPHRAGTIRYAICDEADPNAVSVALAAELRYLVAAPRSEVETTLLIVPAFLPDFLDFNDYLAEADRVLGSLGLVGTVQLVGFHPDFQFAGTGANAPENFTNRSPHPMFHLLREESISEVADTEDLSGIPDRNTRTLRRLGMAGILERLEKR